MKLYLILILASTLYVACAKKRHLHSDHTCFIEQNTIICGEQIIEVNPAPTPIDEGELDEDEEDKEEDSIDENEPLVNIDNDVDTNVDVDVEIILDPTIIVEVTIIQEVIIITQPGSNPIICKVKEKKKENGKDKIKCKVDKYERL